ncbi:MULTISPECIES: FixH family protein [unclassified Vibrio]|uniref:FixH family protein n=1 Tax=unclassified Vibrio TaxID=2614977 RepID=UPI001483A612|nr:MULTISPECIES: FixH family protein [unclassified Vibrio]NNN43750.1 hypothetical protein [Vibrio sp. 1-1(7)]NNN71574.1 hypothetical protein [Vibrio sp. 12-2(3-a)]
MEQPWYKQFWPWFLIILPSMVVIGTLIVVFIFHQNSVSMVTEDYYKKGKGINIDLSKINQAKRHHLKAAILSEGNDVVIQLDKGSLPHYPALNIMFAHRTLPDRDFTQLVTADFQGHYRIKLDEALNGPWFLELSPHNDQWLIQGKVNFPSVAATQLLN